MHGPAGQAGGPPGSSPAPTSDLPPVSQGAMASFGQQQGGYRGQMMQGQQNMPQRKY